jgi:aminoglycoside/choline kinase family phosphotransferase
MERLELQQEFAEKNGWGDADIFPLPSDASTRSYTRLVRGDESCLLMDAPPETEKLPEYLIVGAHLRGLGLRAPEVYAANEADGFALIEDFGDRTFTYCLDRGEDEEFLYDKAVDVLLHFQRETAASAGSIALPSYDMDLMLEEVSRFLLWFVPAVRGEEVSEAERQDFNQAWHEVLVEVAEKHTSFVFRDFHVDNLMLLEGAEGVQSIGVLDFQDALIGSPAYDLMSLIEDARRDISPATRIRILNRYFAAFPGLDQAETLAEVNLLAAQRHTKVAGIFAKLIKERGQTQYLAHLPRVLRLLSSALDAPELTQVRAMTEALVPGFEKAELLP